MRALYLATVANRVMPAPTPRSCKDPPHYGAKAEMLIQDDGIGIPEERHIEALSRFSQAGGGPGSGLGLAIAARVMKNHGGQLSILPSPRGAKIKLSFSLLDI